MTNFVHRFSLSDLYLAVALFSLSACGDKDVYDPNFMQDQAAKSFPVPLDKIDPSHTWETMSLVRARLTFPDTAPDSVFVYASNPFSPNDAPTLLTKRGVKAGTNEFAFDCPSVAHNLFMLVRDAGGYAAAVADTITSDRQLVHDFAADATTRAAYLMPDTRAIDDDYGWTPTDIAATDASVFPTAAPAGAVPLPDAYDFYNFVAEGGNYIVNSSTKVINCSAAANFYVQGNASLTGIYFGGNAQGRIILLPGSRLTMDGLALGITTTLTICPGATLDCGTGTLQLSNNCKNVYNAGQITCGELRSAVEREFYNLGTITVSGAAANLTDLRLMNAAGATFTCNSLDINNASKFINDGNITTTGLCAVKNNNSLLVNRATINAGSFGTEGSSRFFNEDTGQVNVGGLSLVNSNNCTWVNSGAFTTNTMTFNAASENWYNRCRLIVKDLLTIELGGGYLYVDGGGYVECRSLYMNNAKVVLGPLAYFNVLDTATFGSHSFNPWWTQGHQGFFGLGPDNALVRIKRAVKHDEGTYPCINFFNHIQVTTDGFEFPQQVNEWQVNYNLAEGAAAISYGGGTTAIEAGTCGSAYTPEPETEIPSTPQAYTYLFEDMTAAVGDYDFNDCVFSVTAPVNGSLTLTLWAAGCTKTLDLCLKPYAGNSNNTRVLIADLARAFTTPTGQRSDGWIVNTETGTAAAGEIYCKPVTISVDNLPADFSLTENGDFFISDAFGQVHIPKFTEGFQPGQVPYALRVPGQWNWPVEFIPVASVYSGFDTWARNATAETNWYERGYAEGYVFPKSLLPQ